MTVFVHVCAGCQVPGRHPTGRCWHCRASARALTTFGVELAQVLRERERLARQRGLADSTGLLDRMRRLLAGNQGVKP